MTLEISGKDRTSKMIKFFVDDGFEAIRLLSSEAIKKFNITPAEFYGILLSLVESFTKCFTTNNDTKLFKEIFDDEKRQNLVNFFEEAIHKFYLTNKN